MPNTDIPYYSARPCKFTWCSNITREFIESQYVQHWQLMLSFNLKAASWFHRIMCGNPTHFSSCPIPIIEFPVRIIFLESMLYCSISSTEASWCDDMRVSLIFFWCKNWLVGFTSSFLNCLFTLMAFLIF